MDDDTLIKLKSILRGHNEIFFPVKELYNNRLISSDLPPLESLVQELRAQPDLVVTKNLKTRDEDDPVVMLKERIPTLNEIIAKVRASIGGTLENLNQTYTAGIGEMTSDEEDLLLETMRRTKACGKRWSKCSPRPCRDRKIRLAIRKNDHDG
jgi:hypothetical protein